MKLTIAILYENLEHHFNLRIEGAYLAADQLTRPVFLCETCTPSTCENVFIAKPGYLTLQTAVQPGSVLICTEENDILKSLNNQCCVIIIQGVPDVFEIFNFVQGIYNKYDAWAEAIEKLTGEEESLWKMLAESAEFLGKPLYIIDRRCQYIARSGVPQETPATPSAGQGDESLRHDGLLRYFFNYAPSMLENKPFLLQFGKVHSLCINLFSATSYIGCLCMDYSNRVHTPADNDVLMCLARQVTKELNNQMVSRDSDMTGVIAICRELMDGQPIGIKQRRLLEVLSETGPYVCMRIHFNDSVSTLPVTYVSNMFKKDFPQSCIYEHDDAIICLSKATCKHGSTLSDDFLQHVEQLAALMALRVGISNAFFDIFNAKLHYRQATTALERGQLVNPAAFCFLFEDYVLMDMIVNSLAGQPLITYIPEGMKKLLVHDEQSPVSYIETLRIYLQENMSVTHTANALYIHKSTLIERLTRIEEMLGYDLKDPEKRLLTGLLLKALTYKKLIQRQNAPDA